MTVHILYTQRKGGAWVATTPAIPRLRVVADSYDEAHHRVEEAVRFALDSGEVEFRHAAAG